jgi:hypothetical protein
VRGVRRISFAVAVAIALAVVPAASASVLRVGAYKGISGQFKTIPDAVKAAKPGDWILVGPGDYKTTSSAEPAGRKDTPAGVLLTKPRVYLRGMNRNTVVVDGTKSGPTCSRAKQDQNFGPHGKKGALGLNGIMVWKAANVWVQNLTACNFLSGKGDAGNEVWWNGGDGSGKVGGHNYYGSYLSATNTFFKGNGTAAQYGIFSSNWTGGTWFDTYTSNFSDSGYYIGACQQQCDQTMDKAWGEFSSLGYSGSNSGGTLIIKNSEFDQNTDGFDTNSQNGDNPPPQNGACPSNKVSPITHTHSCWVFMDNYVHDNNNPNVPGVGLAGEVPVGTGVSLTAARNDTLMHNRIVRNNAWGVLLQIFPDDGPPCTGGVRNVKVLGLLPVDCLFDGWGNAVLKNTFAGNGSFGHATNGDIAALNVLDGKPTNCYRGNTDTGGLTTSPSGLEQSQPKCDGTKVPANNNGPLAVELLCGNEGAQVDVTLQCPGGKQYPARTKVVMHALPKGLKTMPDPCKGVPHNPWCPARKAAVSPPPVGLG